MLTETHVYRYDRDKKQFHLFRVPTNNEKVLFQDFIEDKQGNYWFATWHNGLYQYKIEDKKFRWFSEKDNISERNISSLITDPIDSSVWIGTFEAGVYRYDPRRDTIFFYTETHKNTEYRQLMLIRDIAADASEKLWLTTVGFS